MNIKILSKDDTLKIISDETFISTWKSLAGNTTHCTVIQEYGFVVSWYQSYLDKYKPMMLLGYDDEENIVGILPLAIAYDTGHLSHAGEDQAEYHSWICAKEYEEAFLIQSLISIKKEFNTKQWKWGWMPPEVNIDWFDSSLLKENGIYINSITSESPLHNLENPDKLHRLKKNRANKSKINRLKRKGELRIERIRDRGYAEELFEVIMAQYNFRHLALYNHIPFESDKNKRIWHLNQMDIMPENTHFTVLWHGDELLACNIGYCTTDKVLLGFTSYDPSKGADSPGSIFLIKLLEFIKEEGYNVLDLTPGGDSYKERFSNAHINLVKPTICFNKYYKIKDYTATSLLHYIKKYFKTKDIMSMKDLIRKNISLLRKKVLEPKNTMYSYYVYRGETEEIGYNNNIFSILNDQQYTDLLLYQQSNDILSPKELTYSAIKKFERGDRLYTMTSDEKLIAFAWLAGSGKKHWRPSLKDKINYKKNSLYIYDFYTSNKSRKNNIFQSCIQSILKEIQNEKISALYLIKPIDIDKKVVNKLGFSPIQFDANQ